MYSFIVFSSFLRFAMSIIRALVSSISLLATSVLCLSPGVSASG